MTDEFRKIPIEKLLRRVAVARANGDWTAARAEWWACIARARERVVSVVDREVFKGTIPAADAEDTVQKALIRGGQALVANLDDLSENAFFAAMVKVAWHQCMDDGRAFVARDKRSKSLDQPAGWSDSEDPVGRYDHVIAEQARADWERAQDMRDLEQLFDRLIAQLKDVRAQKILTADRVGGLSDDDLARALDITKANLQQIRSRALKELRGLIEP